MVVVKFPQILDQFPYNFLALKTPKFYSEAAFTIIKNSLKNQNVSILKFQPWGNSLNLKKFPRYPKCPQNEEFFQIWQP